MSDDSMIGPPRRRILSSDLCNVLETYLEPTQVSAVYRAYLFSAEAHEHQKRLSGEFYIFHPIAVAYILAEMRMDPQTVMAALLHDVIEDTPISKEQLGAQFSEEVAELVDGVSKLTRMPMESREQAQAASFRKMLMAMNRDIRVIIIKLADRLHNLQTIGVMKPESQRRIARETLEIYAPLARRLGMNGIRVRLEELSFATLYPHRYRVLTKHLRLLREQRQNLLQDLHSTIEKRFQERQMPQAEVVLRERTCYGVYSKMLEKKNPKSPNRRHSFQEVTSLYAFRVIVDTLDECYKSLGIIHGLYVPSFKHFRDYIAVPKKNGYQSLHTQLMGYHDYPIEVQIRTRAMDEFAEKGIAAHWLYKLEENPEVALQHENSTNYAARQRASAWLRDLIEVQKNASDSLEFLEDVKRDLFPDEVYVFTPKGKILHLPNGATAIDFAYAVHSDVGNHSIAVKIDRHYTALSVPLVSGQTVEITTAAWSHPSANWLDFAFTPRARNHIRHYLKNMKQEQALELGKRILEKELSLHQIAFEKVSPEQKQLMLQTLQLGNMDKLYSDIGLGYRMALIVVRQLEAILNNAPTNTEPTPLLIRGTEGSLVNYASCCNPIPGDKILGFMTDGNGIEIHTLHCKHYAKINSPEKIIPVAWESQTTGSFVIEIRIDVRDGMGVLARVASALSEMQAEISAVHGYSTEMRSAGSLRFQILVRDRLHLANIMRHLRRLPEVMRIQRGNHTQQPEMLTLEE